MTLSRLVVCFALLMSHRKIEPFFIVTNDKISETKRRTQKVTVAREPMSSSQQKPVSKAAEELLVDVVRSEFSDDVLQQIIAIVLSAIDKFILTPTQVTLNPEQIKLLEREVERTSLVPMSKFIKQQLDEHVGPTFHVVYGRSYGLQVTHERCNFAHLKIDGADIVVWKHGA